MRNWLLISGTLLIINLMAVRQDLKTLKISNRLIIAGGMTGLVINIMNVFRISVQQLLVAVALPAVLLWPLLMLSMIGAADIKLLMVSGIFLGPGRLLRAMMAAALIGGVWAAVRMTRRHLWRRRMGKLAAYARSAMLRGPEAYMDQTEIEAKAAWLLPFSAAVCAGDLVVCLLELPL